MSERDERPTDTAGPLPGGARMDGATEGFVAHRNLLFTVAYEMLGSAADAEDVLQETWLRWAGDRPRRRPGTSRAYLVRITTRQALSRLRALGRRKEVVRRPLAARAAAHRAGRGRGRRAGGQRLDGDDAGARDADADRAGGVRAARGVRPGVRGDRRRPSARARPRSARSRTGRGRTSRRDGRRGSSPRPRPGPRSRRSSRRSKQATCGTCSTSSRLTSSCWPTGAESCGPRWRPSPGPTRWPAC